MTHAHHKATLFRSHHHLPKAQAERLAYRAQGHINKLESILEKLLAALKNPDISPDEIAELNKLVARTEKNIATLREQLEKLQEVK